MREPLDDKIDWIKTHVDMYQVLEMCGIDRPDRNQKIRSIFNEKERTPSMHIYPDHYFCYATGQGGDQIQFVREYKGLRMREAVNFLAGGGDPNSRRIEADRPTELPDLTEIWLAKQPKDPTKEQWGQLRNLIAAKWPTLTVEDIYQFGSKLVMEKLWTPHWEQLSDRWVVRGIKTRSIYTGAKRAIKGSTFRQALYQANYEPTDNKVAVIVEGESDTWVLTKAAPWVDVYGLPSGAGLWRDEWRSQLEQYEKIGIAFDTVSASGKPDEAGIEAIDRVTGSLATGGKSAIVLEVPGGRVAEAVAAGWRIDD